MGYYDPPDVNEGNYNIECKGYLPEDTRALTSEQISDLRSIQQAAGGNQPNVPALLERFILDALAMPKAVDVECNYEGSVDAQFAGAGTSYTVYWTCPRCGTEAEEDREVGDDHPDL